MKRSIFRTMPTVNEGAMSATAVICTPAIDRERERILPSGGDFTDYRLNPVVLWEHGQGGVVAPIAKCETPDGRLALVVTDKEITATAFFADRDPVSRQFFGLIAEGIIRATSIHVIPLESYAEYDGGREVTVYPTWKMLEWSWCKIGCNPEAVRRTLSRNKIGGERLIPAVAKALGIAAHKAESSARPSARELLAVKRRIADLKAANTTARDILRTLKGR